MTFDEVLDQVRELLRRRGRVTYRSLKLRYQLGDELLAGVTDELVKAERVAADENGEVLVWTGEGQRAGGEEQGAKNEEAGGEKLRPPRSAPGPLPLPREPKASVAS